MINRIVYGILIALMVAAAPVAATFEAASAWGFSRNAAAAQEAGGRQEPEFKALSGPGKKCKIDDDVYFTYEFSERPKMGMVILKIQIFDKGGAKITPFLLKGRSDMPEMRGAHDSGDQEFKLNRKNDYLLPLNIVMPGEWEVRLTFLKEGKPVFFGRLDFNV